MQLQELSFGSQEDYSSHIRMPGQSWLQDRDRPVSGCTLGQCTGCGLPDIAEWALVERDEDLTQEKLAMSAMVYWSAASHSWSFRRSSSTCMHEGHSGSRSEGIWQSGITGRTISQ